jgi:hypothetical protein
MLLAKKQSIEEQMCQSIFYNLSILKLAVKSSKEFDECFSNVSYLKFRSGFSPNYHFAF